MSNTAQIPSNESIVHQGEFELNGSVIYFSIVDYTKALHVWIGTSDPRRPTVAPSLGASIVCVPSNSNYDLSHTSVLSGSTTDFETGFAQKLSKKLNRFIWLSIGQELSDSIKQPGSGLFAATYKAICKELSIE